MSKRRIPSHVIKARAAPERSLDVHRYIGISLSGGKSDKAAVAVLEYFPEQKKVFLSKLHEKIKTDEFISADLKLHELISSYEKVQSVHFDVPLQLPKCLRCSLPCPGFETCTEKEMTWLREFYTKLNQKRKPRRIFTPYTERCSDVYLAHSLETKIEVQHAMGANLAPLMARALFIRRRLKTKSYEAAIKPVISKLFTEIKISKNVQKNHHASVGGDEVRKALLLGLCEQKGIFIYKQDMQTLVDHLHAFDAFICAYVGWLRDMDELEPRPSGFPKNEAWPDF